VVKEDLILNLPGFVFFKDAQGVFQGANRLLMNMVGYTSLDQLVGTTDYDMKCEAAEHAPGFVAQDKRAMESGASTALDIHRLADGNVWVYLTKKERILNSNGEVSGVACNSTIIDNPLLAQALITLVERDRQVFASIDHGSYYLDGTYDNYGLTLRESECLFFLLRGKSAKQIGKRLDISPRTVESYIENIKMKFNCKRKCDLIEQAVNSGLVNHIPSTLVNYDVEEES